MKYRKDQSAVVSKALFPSAISFSNFILDQIDSSINIMVDMTMGNGNDSYKLLKKFPSAKLYAFDIQEKAIENTREKLKIFPSSSYDLVLDSHVNIDKYISEADLFIYNFGYLPGADKNIITRAESSLRSLEKAVKILNNRSYIIMIFYTGHDGGQEEYDACRSFLEKLDQKSYQVCEFKIINQVNKPPSLILLEKF